MIEASERRELVYNSLSSRERRAAEARSTDTPRARLIVRHRDEQNEMAARHRDASEKLRRQHDREIAGVQQTARPQPHGFDKRQARERATLRDSHGRERSALADRHRAERSKVKP